MNREWEGVGRGSFYLPWSIMVGLKGVKLKAWGFMHTLTIP